MAISLLWPSLKDGFHRLLIIGFSEQQSSGAEGTLSQSSPLLSLPREGEGGGERFLSSNCSYLACLQSTWRQ